MYTLLKNEAGEYCLVEDGQRTRTVGWFFPKEKIVTFRNMFDTHWRGSSFPPEPLSQKSYDFYPVADNYPYYTWWERYDLIEAIEIYMKRKDHKKKQQNKVVVTTSESLAEILKVLKDENA